MKFSVKINGAPAGELEAKNACDAVDAARASHNVPDEGGDFLIEVSSAEPWEDSAGKVQPPGVVSSFGVSHEPKPHVAEAVYAKREADALAKADADKRAEIESELLERLGLRIDESGKAVSK